MPLSDRWPLAEGALRDRLVAAYDGPARGYHDLRHLAEVLAGLDELAAGGERFDDLLVRLAAWFHDAVYDGEAGPEARSARWAEEALPAHGLSPEQVREVARLVRVTEHHGPGEADENGCALSDADLAILAAGAERYQQYIAGVRGEYPTLTDAEFRAGRATVLRNLVAKQSLFHTGYARSRWEDAARANIHRELRSLERPDG